MPTLCLEHLTPAQARAFMIADNRLTEIATWDDKLLAEQLKELEIDLRIASLEDASDPADDPADAIPELPPRPPLSKRGDLWLLGQHRVLCGNALDSADFSVLLGEERAAIVFTDPPYNVRSTVMRAVSARSIIVPV